MAVAFSFVLCRNPHDCFSRHWTRTGATDFQEAVEWFRDFVDSTGTGAIPSALQSLQTAINTIPMTSAETPSAVSAV